MKRITIQIVVLVAACSISVVVGYWAGFRASRASSKNWDKVTFILSLGALQDIRDGYIPAATRDMETVCFANAHKTCTDPAYFHDTFVQYSAAELIRYFDRYCTNRADWTPEQKLLDKDLTKLKGHEN